MAIEIAEAVVGTLKGELAASSVNVPMVPAEVLSNCFPCSFLSNLVVQVRYFIGFHRSHLYCFFQPELGNMIDHASEGIFMSIIRFWTSGPIIDCFYLRVSCVLL